MPVRRRAVKPHAAENGGALRACNLAAGGTRAQSTRSPPVRALDLRVPEDVAVTGFDDAPWASWVRPRLTTVREPTAAIVAAACDLLQARVVRQELEAGRGRRTPSPSPRARAASPQ
jgi:hypothetical protein